MIEKILTVQNRAGIHARPAAIIAQTSNKFESEITLTRDGATVNAKSIIGLMLAKIEWSDGIYCECDEDIYALIEKWVARSSNVSVHV